jgi:hypothetical protein
LDRLPTQNTGQTILGVVGLAPSQDEKQHIT